MINMLRKVREVDNMLVKGNWNRYIGRELSECIVGVIGCGRIGTKVIHRLMPFNCAIITNDIVSGRCFNDGTKAKCDNCTADYILSHCDIITIHIPLIDNKINNHNFITIRELNKMKKDVRLLNLSRGGIINEEDLYIWLQKNKKATVALDSFKEEAYRGKLRELHNAYLTPHLGSCTIKSRNAMELGAISNARLFIEKKPLKEKVV